MLKLVAPVVLADNSPYSGMDIHWPEAVPLWALWLEACFDAVDHLTVQSFVHKSVLVLHNC